MQADAVEAIASAKQRAVESRLSQLKLRSAPEVSVCLGMFICISAYMHAYIC